MCSQGFGGGPLSEAIGDGLSAAGVRLRSGYGATEFGGPSHIIPTHEEDWKEWSTRACLGLPTDTYEVRSSSSSQQGLLLLISGKSNSHILSIVSSSARGTYKEASMFKPSEPKFSEILGAA